MTAADDRLADAYIALARAELALMAHRYLDTRTELWATILEARAALQAEDQAADTEREPGNHERSCACAICHHIAATEGRAVAP
jgi:cytochrome c553